MGFEWTTRRISWRKGGLNGQTWTEINISLGVRPFQSAVRCLGNISSFGIKHTWNGSIIAPFGSDFGMLGKLPKEAANLVSADISECRRKNWRFPPESGFGGCHPRILVSSHPAPLCYTPMHTICPDHRITGCFPLLTKMTL